MTSDLSSSMRQLIWKMEASSLPTSYRCSRMPTHLNSKCSKSMLTRTAFVGKHLRTLCLLTKTTGCTSCSCCTKDSSMTACSSDRSITFVGEFGALTRSKERLRKRACT